MSERCGACPLIALDYPAALDLKRQRFASLWQARGFGAPELSVVPSPRTVAYRNRLRLRIDAHGKVGFFNENKAHDCVVAEPTVLMGKRQLEHLAARDAGALVGYHHAEVRAKDSRGEGAIVLYGAGEPARGGEAVSALETTGWRAFGVNTALPRALPCQTWCVDENVFLLVPVDAFMQVNWPLNRALVAHVVEGLVERGTRDFADLFMGAGNFGLPLLARGLSGIGVESHAGALSAAGEAARRQGFEFEALWAEDALVAAQRLSAQGRRFDAVVVDPPRAGLKTGRESYAALARRTLVMCSCNPSSLAEDISEICRWGFDVQAVKLFDMFPHTDHVEVVVWLERS